MREMFERIVAQVTVALIGWLDRKMERGSTAVDADPDRDTLRRAGDRIRKWMREQDRIRPGGKPDEGRTVREDAGLPHGRRGVDAVEQPDRRP